MLLSTDERFDYAQNCKQAVELLHRAGLRLGKYEIEKRLAIEEENYDRAKQKKDHIDEYRTSVMHALRVQQLLEEDGVSVHCGSQARAARRVSDMRTRYLRYQFCCESFNMLPSNISHSCPSLSPDRWNELYKARSHNSWNL